MKSSLVRLLLAAVLLLGGLCLIAPPAKAQVTGTDLTAMKALASLPNWSQALTWDPNTNPCPASGSANWSGVTCNRQGRVVIIVATCNSTLINGQIPGTLLSQLTALTSLDIRGCGLWGPIPDAMQTLTQITRLRLDVNSLSGTLPPWLASLPNLGYLEMAGNRFTGSIPAFPSSSSVIIGLDVNFLSDLPASWTQFNRSLTYNNINPFPASCTNASATNQCGPNRLASWPTVTVTKVSGDGQWAQTGSTFANPLSVTVTDLSNNPVAGATVTFSGPGITTTTATTDNNGLASATVTASSTVGGNTVTAAVGLTGMTTFGLTAGDVTACLGNIQVTSNADTGSGTLREALANVCPGGTVDLTPIAGQTIALSASATSYNFSGRLYIGDDVIIAGQGVTISGSGNTRIFFIQGGNVSMSNLTLTDGLGQGGSSQYGGPAAGMGGAIFQNGGALTLTSVVFTNNTAQGGTTDTSGLYTGGGFGANSSGGDLGGANGAGDGAGGLQDGVGDPGGFGGGGGYGNTYVNTEGGPHGVFGGIGGFGASAGNAPPTLNTTTNQIATNFNVVLGNGYGAVQAGGAGFGGAIFTRAGTLNLIGDAFSGNSAVGGASGAQGKGGSLFIYDTASFNVDAATTVTGSVAAAAGAAGIGYSPTISGDLTYEAGNTCPFADTTDLCGVASNYALAGPSSAAYQSTFQVTPASNNTVTPTLSILSGPCSISGTTVSVTGASGACVVQASWAANGIYPASTATRTVNVTPASAASACVAPLATLTAWYKAEGNANDVTGAFNGTAAGDLSYAGGKVGQAFSFDGTQSPSVALPAAAFPATQTAFSFETWFRTSGETGGVILGHQDQPAYTTPVSHTPAIYVGTNGKLYIQALYSNSTQFVQSVSAYPVNDSQWHHVAVTFDGSKQIAYLDGVAFGSQTIGSGAQLDPYYQLGTGYTNGWQEGNGGWYTFNGLIDEATVYSAVLQPSDILNIISAGTYGKCNVPKTFTATVGTNQPGTSFSVDGAAYTSTQQFTWDMNSQHTIATTATQAGTTGTQYVFSGWSDSGALSHSVTFTAATTYTASFQTQYWLTTAANPVAGGTVTASGYFNAGTSPTVTATPAANYVFGSWSGPAISPGAQSSVLMSAPESLTANFLQTQSINFTAISTQVLGTPLALSATATSGLAVSYQSTTQTVCTVNGSTVTFLTSGLCSLTASQAGNTSYAPATPVTQAFTVAATPVTPSVPNNGVFPATSVGVTSSAITFTITFNKSDTLGAAPYVLLTQGTQHLDFQAAASQAANACVTGHNYNVGDICTVAVTFTPAYAGLRLGAFIVTDNSGNQLSSTPITGVGTGPQVTFPASSAAISSVGGGFRDPQGVALDGSGNVYVADGQNNTVKVFPPSCTSASCGINLGGGFNAPVSLAVDGAGNIYVADSYNYAIKVMPPACINSSCVATLAGGFNQPEGVALDGKGNVYVADTSNSEIKMIPATCTSASCVTTLGGGFSFPSTVAVDARGNVYVTDQLNNAVKEIPPGCTSANCVLTLGTSFSQPEGLAVDAAGNVYLGDQLNNAVKEIPAGCTSAACTMTLGQGFSFPEGIALDGNGNLYVADSSHSAIKKIALASPPSLNFASTNVNSTSSDSPQTVTVQNSGNASLLESALTIGTNFTQVAGSGTPADCTASTTLFPGASCNLSLSFKPTTSGPLSALAILSNNAPASPQSISLSGTGVVPPSTLSVTVTPIGTFTQGQTAEWDVQVYNLAASATNATSGTTTLVDTLPTGYTLSSFVGTGWNCNAVTTTVTCTSTQVVAGASGAFTKLQLIVNVPAASATSVTDNVSVYGGGDPNHTSLGTAATSFSTVSVAQAAGSITITGGNSQSTAVNTAFANSLAVTVKDSGGNLASGVNVTFTAPATGPSGVFSNSTSTITVATNASGVASAPFTANTTAGSFNVSAVAGQLSTPFSLTNTAGAAASITANTGTTPQSATINTPFANPLAVTVKDTYGNPVSGANVLFQAGSQGPSGLFSNNTITITVATNSSGIASAPFTANSLAGGPSYFVTATLGQLSTSFELANTAGAAASITAVTGTTPQSATVNTAFANSLAVTVKDSGGNVVSGANVVFTAPATGPSGVFSNGNSTITVQTNGSGVASAPFTANTTAGPFNVSAAAGQLSTPFSLTNTAAAAASITANTGTTPQSATINTAFANPLAVTLKDSYGNLVSGANVVFTAPSTGPSGVFSNSTVTITVQTNSSGTTSAPFTANATAGGPYSVTATTGQLSTPFSLTNNAGAAASITANTGTTPQSASVNSAFPNPLAVTVKDSGGNLLSGVSVTFTAPSTGASGVFSNTTNTITLLTNSTGVASAPITANANGGGPYNVIAKAGQLTTPFTLTNSFLTQTIQNFGTIPTQTVGTPLLLTATATSGLAVSYQSTTLTVCTVNGSSATFLTPGQCSLTASQTGNSSYSAAQPITQQFTVNPNIPTISNLQAVSVGGNSELITWTTDQPATTTISGTVTTTPDSNLVTFHSVTLTGLSQNTTYNYSVSSTNSTNGTATSPSANFTTTPYVGYVAFWGVNNSGITISWSTDFAATTFVAYGTTSALGQLSPVQSALSNSHGAVLTGLNPGTTYYFRAESTDANNHTGASMLYTFTTTGQPASPAPVITNVTVTNITTTGATITWTTDQAATTQVNYGTTTAYGSSSSLNSSLVTSHSVTLTNLTPGTTYNYDVISTNSSGTSSGMSTNYTFSTTAVIATPPAISNIQAAVTSTTATITWTTDQPANSAISGTVTTTPDSNYVTSHSVTLTGLTPGTLYNFSVISTNAAALTTTSPASTFTTTAANATAPYVGYVAFWGVNNSGVTISWSTDVPANTQLNYGTSPSLGTLTPVQATLANSHGVVLTNLASGTTYYFVAQSTGANGATGYSTTYSFTTTGSPSAPAPNISNIQTTVTATTATITWTTDEAASSQVNYGVTTTYAASSTLNSTLTTSHSIMLTNLMPGTTYNFDVVSSNVNNLSSTSNNSTFQTTGSAPGPIISSVAASSITSSTALITWTTDQAATSVVNYGNQTVSSPTLVTSHSVTLSGLTPNTQYSFTVTSVNASSVSTTSNSTIFTTSAQSAAPPVISYLAFWGVTSSGVTISWSTNVPSNTAVNYGQTGSLGTVTPVQTALANTHGVTLTNLQPSTTYYFEAQSADVNGNTGTSTIYSFTTLAGGLPVISNLLVTPNANNTANISWTTSVPTNSYVQYGPSSGNYNRYSAQTNLTSSPNCTLSYVPSGTVYYQLVSTDGQGNQVVSPEAKFVEP